MNLTPENYRSPETPPLDYTFRLSANPVVELEQLFQLVRTDLAGEAPLARCAFGSNDPLYSRFGTFTGADSYLDLLRDKPKDCWRCRIAMLPNGEIIGAGECIANDGEPQEATLGFLVRTPFHHRGIATRLLLALVEDARALGKTAVTLEYRYENTPVACLCRALASKFGFTRLSREVYGPEVIERFAVPS